MRAYPGWVWEARPLGLYSVLSRCHPALGRRPSRVRIISLHRAKYLLNNLCGGDKCKNGKEVGIVHCPMSSVNVYGRDCWRIGQIALLF